VTLGVGHVEERAGAQPFIDLTGLGDQRGDLHSCPQVNAAGLKRDQDRVGNRQRGAKATSVAPSNVNHNLVVLLAELPHLPPDRSALKLDRGEVRLVGNLGAELRKCRGTPLLVAVDQQNVTTALRQHSGHIDGDCGFANAAFAIADCKDHGRTLDSR
jgi:hypothetical protein